LANYTTNEPLTLMVSCDSRGSLSFLGLASSSSDLTLLLHVDPIPPQLRCNYRRITKPHVDILPSVTETMATAENHAWKIRAAKSMTDPGSRIQLTRGLVGI
jgi:hypothetical protein